MSSGRDLLDLQVALNSGKIDVDRVLECYRRYIEFVVEKQPTYKQFVQNMELKMQDPEFLGVPFCILVDNPICRFLKKQNAGQIHLLSLGINPGRCPSDVGFPLLCSVLSASHHCHMGATPAHTTTKNHNL